MLTTSAGGLQCASVPTGTEAAPRVGDPPAGAGGTGTRIRGLPTSPERVRGRGRVGLSFRAAGGGARVIQLDNGRLPAASRPRSVRRMTRARTPVRVAALRWHRRQRRPAPCTGDPSPRPRAAASRRCRRASPHHRLGSEPVHGADRDDSSAGRTRSDWADWCPPAGRSASPAARAWSLAPPSRPGDGGRWLSSASLLSRSSSRPAPGPRLRAGPRVLTRLPAPAPHLEPDRGSRRVAHPHVSQSLLLALIGPLCAIAQRRRFMPLWVAGAWMVEEAIRDRVPFGGFPWGRLAFSQSDSPLTGLASWGGAPLLSFAVALGGGLMVLMVRAAPRRHPRAPSAAPAAGYRRRSSGARHRFRGPAHSPSDGSARRLGRGRRDPGQRAAYRARRARAKACSHA